MAAAEDSMLITIEEDNLKGVKDALQTLYSIWQEFGLQPDQKETRARTVWGHVNNLLHDIVDEETTMRDDIKERIANYKIKIEALCKELSIPHSPEVDAQSIIKTEEVLRKQVDVLSKEKHTRVKQFKDLKTEEVKHCKLLGLPELQLSSTTGVPSASDIREIEEHLSMLNSERQKRQKRLYLAKKELTTILETTELSPETSLEKEILSGKEDTISLTGDTFKALEECICKHQKRKAEMEAEKQKLTDRLHVMWERLKIEEGWRQEFLSHHKDCKLSTLKSIQQEVEKLEKLKRENTKMFVEMIRKELNELWDKCLVGESERMLFHPYFDNHMTDSLLEVHEAEAEKWRDYLREVGTIVKKIENRSNLWDKMIDFEKRVADPHRLKNNRGGKLLKEERERKKFQKDLPALENEIFNQIQSYEEESGKSFQYFGEDYRAFVTRQWEERLSQKENIKLERQNKRQLEITLKTPSKRMLQTPGVPRSAPSKLLKSTLAVLSNRTPLIAKPKVIPSTLGKVPLKKTGLFSPLVQAKANHKNDPNVSVVLELPSTSTNTTTYERFASLLNKTNKRALRSSVLSSRKSGGSRISKSGSISKRKSVGKSALRRSTRKSVLSASSTLTPARGKLGLPFII